MTYRELLELYKAGELELEQRKRIEKDIEKQEAISDYLYEQEGIPGLEDVFAEEDRNSFVFADGRQTETGKEKAEADAQEQRARGQRGKNKDRRSTKEEDIDTEFITMINRSIRRAFRRLGLTVLALAFALILFVQFCFPTIVSCFYYNPAENIGNKDYTINKMSRDMAVYSEVFLPGKRRVSVEAESKGYGKYNITVNQTSSFTRNLTDVSGEIVRGKLRYYDNNILKTPVSNAFAYSNLVGKEENTLEENLQCTRKYFQLKENEEVNMCAAGTKEQSIESLKNLDSQKMYIGYISLDKIMSYADFKKYVDEQDLSEVWCAVQVLEPQKDKEDIEDADDSSNKDKAEAGEEYITDFLSGAANIGFVCVPSYNAAFNWDDKKYPALLPGCETDQMDEPDHWDSVENNLKKENYARQHFVSLLNYISDQKQFLEMIAGDDYSPEALKEMASYVKKNGLKIYGFTTIADKDTLLKLSKQSEVYEIYTEELN